MKSLEVKNICNFIYKHRVLLDTRQNEELRIKGFAR